MVGIAVAGSAASGGHYALLAWTCYIAVCIVVFFIFGFVVNSRLKKLVAQGQNDPSVAECKTFARKSMCSSQYDVYSHDSVVKLIGGTRTTYFVMASVYLVFLIVLVSVGVALDLLPSSGSD